MSNKKIFFIVYNCAAIVTLLIWSFVLFKIGGEYFLHIFMVFALANVFFSYWIDKIKENQPFDFLLSNSSLFVIFAFLFHDSIGDYIILMTLLSLTLIGWIAGKLLYRKKNRLLTALLSIMLVGVT